MEIPEKKMGLKLDPYIQGAMRPAREKPGPHEVSKKDPTMRSSQQPGVRKQTAQVDRVDISERARDVQKVRTEMDKAPEVRAEKVQKLKASLSRGTYRVKGKEIASKMLKEHLLDLVL